ncbi:MAG: MFS transporter [Candidatus Lokiarchaeota archaeon]|nr:MFS transporter [Candidatus Lokiarchaeota archaeon]
MEKDPTSDYSAKGAVGYSFGQISLITSYQAFTFLIFTFYFAVVGIPVDLITLGFIIWSIWNAFNDPLMGFLSDRTHTRWGRRRPYIMFFLGPLAAVMFFLFFPPLTYGITDTTINFIYFVVIIMVFEFCYTTYDINLTSMLPEIFITKDTRMKANNIRQVFAIIGLIFAFLLPGFFIEDYSNKDYINNYAFFGITLTVIIVIVGILFLKFTPRERPEFQQDHKDVPGFFTSFRTTLKNKSFRLAVPAFIGDFFVDTILPTIIPLYGKYVLKQEGIILSLLLGVAFIAAALSITVIWKPLARRIGIRKMWMISSAVWMVTLFPLIFDLNLIFAFIVFFLVGIGLGGSLYSKDLIVSDIIDEDEVRTGTRRDASFFGSYIFFLRVGYIFVFLAISLVFTNVGWKIYEPDVTAITAKQILGLKFLAFVYPAMALTFIILAMWFYPLHGEYLKEIKTKLARMHEDKKARLS